MSDKSISIRTIAAEAGVSIKTVSNYINGTATLPMSGKTALAVREAMRKHNFRLNASGSLMRSKSAAAKKAVFIFGHHPELHPARVYAIPEVSELLIAIAEMASKLNVELTVRHVPLNGSWLNAIIDAEIVIAYGSPREYLASMCERRNIPLILLANMNFNAFDAAAMDIIYWTREDAPLLALKHFAGKGIAKTCYLSTWNVARVHGQTWNSPSDLALKQYEDLAGEYGEGSVVLEAVPEDKSVEAEIKNAYHAVMANKMTLLAAQGIIAENDYIAIGSCIALRDLGRRVGSDVFVMGCGDYREGACFIPSISTVAFDRAQCVSALAGLMERRLVHNGSDKTVTAIPLKMIGRESA